MYKNRKRDNDPQLSFFSVASQTIHAIIYGSSAKAHRRICIITLTTVFLTQSANLPASCAAKLDSCCVRNSADQSSNVPPFVAQQNLGERFSTRPEITEDKLQPLDVEEKSSFLNLAEHVGCQLIRRVVAGSLGFAEAQMATASHKHGISIWSCQSQNCVVFVRVNMEMVRRLPVAIRVWDQFRLYTCCKLTIVSRLIFRGFH